LGPFSLIVLIPPLALLGLGALARWSFEILTHALRRRDGRPNRFTSPI
jgi:hypothetical protein